MIRAVSKRSSGSLFHYAHFFQDCLFPEFIAGFHGYETVVREKSLDQSIGQFKAVYEQVMGNRVVEVEPTQFALLETPLQEVATIDRPTYDEYERFRQHVFFLVDGEEETDLKNQVVLIRRGGRRELLDDPELMKQNLVLYSATTGSERREIRSLNQVEKALQEVYGQEGPGGMNGLVVAELESMTFAEQVHLFRGARAIIGIHGAGLANMVFCRPGTTLIEVDPEWPFHWVFVNHFCEVYGVKRVCCPNDPAAVIRSVVEIPTRCSGI